MCLFKISIYYKSFYFYFYFIFYFVNFCFYYLCLGVGIYSELPNNILANPYNPPPLLLLFYDFFITLGIY